MAHATNPGTITRRRMLETMGQAAAVTVAATPVLSALGRGWSVHAQTVPLSAVAGIDRVVMLHGKTYLHAWGGYGQPPAPRGPARGTTPPPDARSGRPGPVDGLAQDLRPRRRAVR